MKNLSAALTRHRLECTQDTGQTALQGARNAKAKKTMDCCKALKCHPF